MGKSTFMTGVAIAMSMIGSSMVLLPITFSQYGIFINSFFCVLPSPLSYSWRAFWGSLASC